ncbi:uncharacterized protein BO80DRAFT_217975 [Aspergillus ibericus CBS 121593]|uniref:Uncharacterized protein n=1 Tax=Aspergillus ibericus CBS 121593 TaxID=1448316 RepID=A0A395GMG4_9EURO|nr:hypothetical protein BO80DRAFT_217975 [Aspergillus ibericus CBS 121593]RAK96695.1 hypothetical protein BO80DRAFT_217975 [Aspergillus ibericus CBS 121593]
MLRLTESSRYIDPLCIVSLIGLRYHGSGTTYGGLECLNLNQTWSYIPSRTHSSRSLKRASTPRNPTRTMPQPHL